MSLLKLDGGGRHTHCIASNNKVSQGQQCWHIYKCQEGQRSRDQVCLQDPGKIRGLDRISGARGAEKDINSLGDPKGQKQNGVWRTVDEYVARLCDGLTQERIPGRRNSRSESAGWRRQLELLKMPV